MQGYRASILDKSGVPLEGVTVTVYKAGTLVLATLFSDNIGTGKANPFPNDSNGTYEFYAANFRYDIVLTRTGNTFDNLDTKDILLYDPSDAVGGSIFGQNVYVRSHPDWDSYKTKVMLVKADRLILESTADGSLINTTAWDRLVADIAASGAGGLCAGCTEVASAWYELWGLRKSSDGTKAVMLHRAKNRFTDTGQNFTTTPNAARALRLSTATATDKLAQGFQSTTAASQGPIEFVDIDIDRQNSPTGTVWLTIETDAAGSPSGVVQATSDKLDIAALATSGDPFTRFVFRNPFTPVIATQYHLVLQGDYAKSDTVNIRWRGVAAGGYANGSAKEYNGSVWAAASGNGDFWFKVYTALTYTFTLPAGYDQKVLLSYHYNNSGSDLEPMEAINHYVKPLLNKNTSLGAAAFGNPALIDLAAFLPPVPVKAFFSVKDASAASSMKISEITAGYANISTGDAGFGQGIGYVTTQGAEGGSFHPPLFVEAQAVYAAGGAPGKMFLMGWEW